MSLAEFVQIYPLFFKICNQMLNAVFRFEMKLLLTLASIINNFTENNKKVKTITLCRKNKWAKNSNFIFRNARKETNTWQSKTRLFVHQKLTMTFQKIQIIFDKNICRKYFSGLFLPNQYCHSAGIHVNIAE